MKMSNLATTLRQDDIAFWNNKVLGYDPKYVTAYYKMNSYDPRVEMTKDEFMISLTGIT